MVFNVKFSYLFNFYGVKITTKFRNAKRFSATKFKLLKIFNSTCPALNSS